METQKLPQYKEERDENYHRIEKPIVSLSLLSVYHHHMEYL